MGDDTRNVIHLHHSYPQSCRSSLDDTLQGTNQKDITCVVCLSNMYPPVDDRIRLADDHREAMLGVLTLPKNADKGGWHDMPVDELLQLLDGEIEEFYAALWGFRHHGEPLDRVIAEAGDCSAFIAMIVDNCKKGLANA